LYEIQQQQQIKLLQTFPQEHPSVGWIESLIQLNSNTLISSSDCGSPSYSDSNVVIVIWTKSPNSLYEPIQRITQKEAGRDIRRLVVLKQKKEEEEQFASCSYWDASIIIWRRGKGDGEEFQIKQKIENVIGVKSLLYISLTNELISGSASYLLQIWSPSSSSDFVERQKIEIPSSPGIWSLCQINKNDSRRIEFASGHLNGQIIIWSKPQQQINESKYSVSRKLQPFNNNWIYDLISINENGFNLLISCSRDENKIVVYKGEEEKVEELEHESVWSLIPMSNGQFASGGYYPNQCLNIWSPSFSSSS
jgi:hypothetical protein